MSVVCYNSDEGDEGEGLFLVYAIYSIKYEFARREGK
jgi:hypothetical protein